MNLCSVEHRSMTMKWVLRPDRVYKIETDEPRPLRIARAHTRSHSNKIRVKPMPSTYFVSIRNCNVMAIGVAHDSHADKQIGTRNEKQREKQRISAAAVVAVVCATRPHCVHLTKIHNSNGDLDIHKLFTTSRHWLRYRTAPHHTPTAFAFFLLQKIYILKFRTRDTATNRYFVTHCAH